MNAPAKHGVILDMPMADYLALKAFSSGMAHRLLSHSPLHAWIDSPWNPNRPADDNEAAEIGTLAHACLLEGGTDNVRVFNPADFPNKTGKGVATGWTNNAIREARDAARAAGEIPILREHFDEVQEMVKTAKDYIADSELDGIFEDGQPEVVMLFDQGGIACKARADFLKSDRRICLSYKTVGRSANPDVWIRAQLPQVDAATVFYERAVMASCGVEEVTVVHLIQEIVPPYACSLVALSPAYRALAEQRLDSALAVWKRCADKGYFPPYPSRIAYAEPKPWQQAEQEEREADTLLSDDELKNGIPA